MKLKMQQKSNVLIFLAIDCRYPINSIPVVFDSIQADLQSPLIPKANWHAFQMRKMETGSKIARKEVLI